MKSVHSQYLYLVVNESHLDQMATYKHLDGGVYFVSELPMTPSGKILQMKVKQMAQSFYHIRKSKHGLAKL